MRLRLVTLLAALNSACGPSESILTLPAELSSSGTHFYVFLIEDTRTQAVESTAARPIDAGPLRMSVEPEEEKRLHLFSYRRPPELVGLTLGELVPAGPEEASAPLPAPDAAWTSAISGAKASAWAKVESPDTSEIAFRIPAEDPCLVFEGASEPWEIEALPMTDLTSVLPLSRSRMLLGGFRIHTPPPPTEAVLGFAEFLAEYTPLPVPFQRQEIRSLVRSGDRVFGATPTELFELDPSSGSPIRTSTIPDGTWELLVGTGGQGLVFDKLARKAHWVDLEALRSRPMEGPADFGAMLPVGPTLVFGAEGNRVHVFDGQSWRMEATLGVGEVTRFFTDGEQIGLILNAQVVYRRQPDGEWQVMPPAIQGIGQVNFGAFLTRGRIILAGGGGTTFGWSGEKWCDLLTGIQRSARGISVSPDRESAFVYSFAESEHTRAPIIRITPRD